MISFVIPAHNEQENIQQIIDNIDSVMGEEEYEIVVVNHGSTDLTSGAGHACAARVVYRPRECSIAQVRNYGVEKAYGDYVCFLDADCRLSEHFLKHLSYLEQVADRGMVATGHLNYTGPRSWVTDSWVSQLPSPLYARGGFMFVKHDMYKPMPEGMRSGEDVWLSENMGWKRDFALMIQHTREPLTLVDFFKKERVRGKGDWSRVRLASFLFPIAAPILSFKKFKFLGFKRRAQNIVLAYAYLLGRLTA